MLELKTILIALFIRFTLCEAGTNLPNSQPLELDEYQQELRTIKLPSKVVSLLVDILQPARLVGYLSSQQSHRSRPEEDKGTQFELVVNSQQTTPDESPKTDIPVITDSPPQDCVDERTRKQNCTSGSNRLEVLRAMSYGQNNEVSFVNLSGGFIYRLDSEAFAGQNFEYIDLSHNRIGVVHKSSFLIGQMHPAIRGQLNSLSRIPVDKTYSGNSWTGAQRSHSSSGITIDFSDNPFIVAMPGAFDHIDVPRCLLNFTGTPVEFKFAAFKKYLMAHPGHLIEADQVNCCEQEWLLNYRNNFLPRARCVHDPSLIFSRASQHAIIESCVTYMISTARNGLLSQPESTIIHQVAASIKSDNDTINRRLNYLLLAGTAMVLSSLSIYVIFYMLSFKAALDSYSQEHKS